jgi:hypothetical protein
MSVFVKAAAPSSSLTGLHRAEDDDLHAFILSCANDRRADDDDERQKSAFETSLRLVVYDEENESTSFRSEIDLGEEIICLRSSSLQTNTFFAVSLPLDVDIGAKANLFSCDRELNLIETLLSVPRHPAQLC